MKRVWFRTTLVLFTSWLIISLYFYSQHNVTVWKYSINKELTINNVKVIITDIYVKNYQKKQDIYPYQNKSYNLLSRLPKSLVMPFLQVRYFYSKPYIFNNEYGTIGLNAKLISNTFIDSRNIEDFPSNIEIEVVDDIGIHYSRTIQKRHEYGFNTIEFRSEGDNFPLEKLNNKLIIYIKENQLNKIQQFTIEPIFVKRNYGIFDKDPMNF